MSYVGKIYKDAYKGLSPATWWLSLVMLINRSGTMVVPFMTLYLTQARHYNIAQAGVVMAVFGAGAICGGLLGGRLTDKFGFYNVQLTSLLCGGAMFIVVGQLHDYLTICCFTFVLAMVNESFRPANSTAIAHYSTAENRTRAYSLNRLAINLGWAAGSALGGFIAATNYQLLFWIDGFTNIGAALLLLVVLSPKRNTQTPHRKEADTKVSRGTSPYKDKLYMFFVVLTVLFAYSFFQLFTTVPVYYKVILHLSPNTIGWVMAVNGLIIALVEMSLVFRLERRGKNLMYISMGVFFIGLSFLVFNLLPGQLLVATVSMLLVTIGEMLSMPFMNSFMVSRTTAENRGQYAGLYTVAWSVAQVLGPFTGTQIVARLGYGVLWWVIGCVTLLCAGGFKYMEWRIDKKARG